MVQPWLTQGDKSLGKGLPCKYEDLSSLPGAHMKESCVVLVIPGLGSRTRCFPGAHSALRMTPKVILLFPTRTHTYVNTHTTKLSVMAVTEGPAVAPRLK